RLDGVRRYLVEHYPADRLGALRIRGRDEVPGDGLTLTVGVCCQDDLFGVFHHALELVDRLALVARDEVLRLEITFNLNPERALGQVTDVPHRSSHGVAAAKIALERACLGG